MPSRREIIHSAELVPTDIDLLVVLGKQIGIRSTMDDIRKSPDHLSDASCINVLAAGILYEDHPKTHILFSGNTKALFPQAAASFLFKHFPNIPSQAVLPPHEDSRDTQSSAENIAKIVRAGDFAGTALVTVGYHAERAADEFDRSGVQLEAVVAAEDIVKNDGTHSEFMAAYEGLGWIIEAEKIKEAGIRNLHLSRLGHLAARLTRP